MQSTLIKSDVYDQEWIDLIKQAKRIGLTPFEVQLFLKHITSEERKILSLHDS